MCFPPPQRDDEHGRRARERLVRQMAANKRSGLFGFLKARRERVEETAPGSPDTLTHQRMSALVAGYIGEAREDPDDTCEELTGRVVALRQASSQDDLKARLPLLKAIWAGSEGLAWVKPEEEGRPGGLEFVVGAGSADAFLAWMLFFACFGGIDIELYGPGLKLFREEIVREVEDPYDIPAVHSHLDRIIEAYGMIEAPPP